MVSLVRSLSDDVLWLAPLEVGLRTKGSSYDSFWMAGCVCVAVVCWASHFSDINEIRFGYIPYVHRTWCAVSVMMFMASTRLWLDFALKGAHMLSCQALLFGGPVCVCVAVVCWASHFRDTTEIRIWL